MISNQERGLVHELRNVTLDVYVTPELNILKYFVRQSGTKRSPSYVDNFITTQPIKSSSSTETYWESRFLVKLEQ